MGNNQSDKVFLLQAPHAIHLSSTCEEWKRSYSVGKTATQTTKNEREFKILFIQSYGHSFIQAVYSRQFSNTMSIHQWDRSCWNRTWVIIHQHRFIICWFRDLEEVLSLNLIFLIHKIGMIMPSLNTALLTLKERNILQKYVQPMFCNICHCYLSRLWAYDERNHKVISFFPHIPLSQSKRAIKGSQRFPA